MFLVFFNIVHLTLQGECVNSMLSTSHAVLKNLSEKLEEVRVQFMITCGSRTSRFLTALGLVSVLGCMTPWAERGLAAQEADHLTCFKVKDTAKVKGEETVDLVFPGLQPPKGVDGCEVKKAEKLVCLSTIKDNGNDGRGPGLAPAYVCYTVECPEDAFTARAFDAITQFGTHRIAAGTLGSEDAQLLCAPATQFFPSP